MGLCTAARSRCTYRVSRLAGSRPRPGKGSEPHISAGSWRRPSRLESWLGAPGARAWSTPAGTPTLGARFTSDGTAAKFRVFSSRATRIEVAAFSSPSGQGEKVVFR